MIPRSRDDCLTLDAADPLAACRAAFLLPEGVIYLDGNSLGALPRATPARLQEIVAEEWGRDLIGGWNKHGWLELWRRIGDKIAGLIGAGSGEVAVGDSTSINLFKALAAALTLRPDRPCLVTEAHNFPTDLYIAEGLVALLGQGRELVRVDAVTPDAIGPDTAVVLLSHVDYRTGAMQDMAAVTAMAHQAGALVVWDLAHSAGAVPIDLRRSDADFAVGCGYKFLNGGPGAPAFLWAHPRHHAAARQPLSGWFGHAEPFAFAADYVPAPGIQRFLCGTPPILSLAALELGVDSVLAVPLAAIRAKSLALSDLFIARVEASDELALLTPRDPARHGSQVSFRHPNAYPVMQALIARGIIGDVRDDTILRFGFAPLYVRYVDIWDAAAALVAILATRAWDDPRYHARQRVP